MKHSVFLVVVLALLIGMTACGVPKETNAETTKSIPTTATSSYDPYEKLQGLDFSGKTVKILCRADEENTSYIDEFGGTELTGDIVRDAIFNRNLQVSERLRIEIETHTMNGYWDNREEFMGVIRNSVAAGSHEYDIVVGYQAYCTALSINGIMLNMLDQPHVDVTQPWWNGRSIEACTVHGKNYWLMGDIGLSSTRSIFAMFYNTDLAKELSLPDIYETVRTGKWTKDKATEYANIAHADLNGDGIMDIEHDRWGYAANQAHELFSAFGISITKIEDGSPSLALNNEPVIHAVEWANRFFYETAGVAPFNQTVKSHTVPLNLFIEGKVLVYPSYLGRADVLREMEDDFAVIPYYKWDEEQKQYATQVHDAVSGFGIPKSCQETNAVGAALEALAISGHYDVLPSYYNQALQNKYVRDSESIEMIELIRENVICSFHDSYGVYLGNISNLMTTLLKQNTTDFASYYAEHEDEWKTMFQDAIEQLSKADQ